MTTPQPQHLQTESGLGWWLQISSLGQGQADKDLGNSQGKLGPDTHCALGGDRSWVGTPEAWEVRSRDGQGSTVPLFSEPLSPIVGLEPEGEGPGQPPRVKEMLGAGAQT